MRRPLLLCLLATRAFAQTDWFPFQPKDYFAPNTLSLAQFLDAPAGKHGFLQMRGKEYTFADGTPVKFWGVNIADHKVFPSAEQAQTWTKFLTKYGINAVRFHKFTWEATDGVHSTQLTDGHWQKLDGFSKTLRDAGIYYGWSHIYGHRVRPADRDRLLAYDEVANTKFPWAHLNGSTSALVNFAEDLQALNIELTVNMLNHRNPQTGLRYADDPALAFVELQNEDDIFWSAIETTLKQTPTYRALLCRQFSDWLRAKYGSQEALERAWNGQGLSPGESLAAGNIYPNPNHGAFQHAEKAGTMPPHWRDRATFLYERQSKFYEKFVKAIRDTGYRGVIVGSCWQAGAGLAHWYNLHTDYLAGAIDRHNYSGGGKGHHLQPGPFDPAAMVSRPGSGLLGTGLQQVSDRPFQLSEWMSLIPTEWTAEAAPLIAAYGLGLQGWDASFAFAMDQPAFIGTVHTPGVYNVTSPTHLTLYPALASMIYRNDVREGKPVADRRINLAELASGQRRYVENIVQDYDRKSFDGEVPAAALAVGPVTVTFTDEPGTVRFDPKTVSASPKRLVSNTGQLVWDVSGKGFFTLNTPGTVGLVGFAPDTMVSTSDLELHVSNSFAVVLVSSLEKAPLATSNRWLVTTVARARNTGMEFSADGKNLVNVGTAPILLEPVRADIRLKRRGKPTVYVLDHVGNRTGETIPVNNNRFVADGAKYRTVYYEVVFGK